MQGLLRSLRYSILFAGTSIVLASNYFAFQTELFDSEYEANHHLPSSCNTLSGSSLTWESFDKDNAPQAFVIDAGFMITWSLLLPSESSPADLPDPQVRIIRDKSPPSVIFCLAREAQLPH